MNISKYQRLFGAGEIVLLISVATLDLLWLLGRALDHMEILNQPKPQCGNATLIIRFLFQSCIQGFG
jgi:hypothetical protein